MHSDCFNELLDESIDKLEVIIGITMYGSYMGCYDEYKIKLNLT